MFYALFYEIYNESASVNTVIKELLLLTYSTEQSFLTS